MKLWELLTEKTETVQIPSLRYDAGFKDVRVLVNPTPREAVGLGRRANRGEAARLRGYLAPDATLLWNAREATHYQLVSALYGKDAYDHTAIFEVAYDPAGDRLVPSADHEDPRVFRRPAVVRLLDLVPA